MRRSRILLPIFGLFGASTAGAADLDVTEFKTIAETERDLILETLKKTKWVIAGPNGAAERLGMNRSTLRFRMNKLGIIKPWKVGNEL